METLVSPLKSSGTCYIKLTHQHIHIFKIGSQHDKCIYHLPGMSPIVWSLFVTDVIEDIHT